MFVNGTAKTKWTAERGFYTTVVATREGDSDVEIVIEQNWDGCYSNATRTDWILYTETGFRREYNWEPFATLRDAKASAEWIVQEVVQERQVWETQTKGDSQ